MQSNVPDVPDVPDVPEASQSEAPDKSHSLLDPVAASFDQPQASERGSISTNVTGVVEQSAFAASEDDAPVDAQFQQLVLNASHDGENIIGNEESQEVPPKPKGKPGAHMRSRSYYRTEKKSRAANHFAKEGVKAFGMINEDMREDEE